MPPLTPAAFGTFFNLTRPSILTAKDAIQNLSRRTNLPISMLLRGQNPFSMAKGGSSIVEEVKISDTGTFGSFNPGDFAAINIVNTIRNLSFQWRFYRSHVGWTDTTMRLHTAGGDKVQIKSFRDSKEQDRVSEHIQGLDSLLFARPNYNTMEAAPAGAGGDTAAAFSIPAWISEDTVRYLPPSTAWGTNALATMDPTTVRVWRNAVTNYDHTAHADPLTGIIAAFDAMELKLVYRPVVGVSDKQMQATSPTDMLIFTNSDGILKTKALYRNAQDRWANQSDAAWNGIAFDGIPFVHSPQLDSELLEQTTGASAAYSGTAYVVNKPRFFFVNKTTLHPVMLDGNILTPEDVMRGTINQPDLNVVWTQTTINVVCNARNRNGIVAPTVPGP